MHSSATMIKSGADYRTPPVDDDVFLSSLDRLADAASAHGCRVAVEPMPMNNIGTVERGVDLIQRLGHPAAGLCLDVWHVRRGGTDYRTLPDLLPIEKVFVVELDDSREEVRGATLSLDSNDHRLYPGEGEFEVVDFVVALAEAGWTGHWGVEMISAEHRALPLEVAVRRAYDSSRAVLDEAERMLSTERSGSVA